MANDNGNDIDNDNDNDNDSDSGNGDNDANFNSNCNGSGNAISNNSNFYRFHILAFLQDVLPSPKKPCLQEQQYEPTVLLQVALMWQSWIPLLHSSISTTSGEGNIHYISVLK